MCLRCVSSVKIGVLGQHSSIQLLQNLSTALPHVVKNIRENWDNVQSIHIKTSSSASLPIWSCGLSEEEGGRWDGLTRVPVPDETDEEVGKGKRRALESEEEPGKKKQKKPDTTSTRESISTSQASRPDPPPTESVLSKRSKSVSSAITTGLSAGIKKLAQESSTKTPTTEVKQKPARAAAVDFFNSDDTEDRSSLHPSPSKHSASKKPTPQKSVEPKPASGSKDSALMKSKSQGENPLKAKTILKSPKKILGSATADVPTEEKHVKFATKLSVSKTKRDKALGMPDKKVRSGGGKSVSAKDQVLGKKVAVK